MATATTSTVDALLAADVKPGTVVKVDVGAKGLTVTTA